MRELLESVGLLQLYGLFEDEEMTDSDILVQMISQPEQLREALKEVGVSRIGQREKIVAALKQKGAETGGTSGQNAIRVTVRYTHVHATDLVIACVLFSIEKGTLAPQACTGHNASYIFSVVHRVLTHNSMRKGVQLLHRQIENIELVEVRIPNPFVSNLHWPHTHALMNALYGNLRLTVSTAAPEIWGVAACVEKLCCLPSEPVFLFA